MHLSKDEVAELVAPHSDTLELVNSWLAHHDIPSSVSPTHGGNWLTLLDVPVSKANDLLGATYKLYQHAETNDTVLRTIGYSVPAVLHKLVQTVAPTTYFGSPRAMRRTLHLRPGAVTLPDGDRELREAVADAKPGSAATVPASCATEITPTCLRALYNTSSYVPAATFSNKLGIAGYLEEFANHTDLTTFMNRFRPDAASAAFTVVPINGGGNDQTHPGTEVSNAWVGVECRKVDLFLSHRLTSTSNTLKPSLSRRRTSITARAALHPSFPTLTHRQTRTNRTWTGSTLC